MNKNISMPKMYTPEQVASMLQLGKSTVYELIKKGEIVAKKIGKVYRIPASSISFVFTGLDYDLYKAEQNDAKRLLKIQQEITKVRSRLR